MHGYKTEIIKLLLKVFIHSRLNHSAKTKFSYNQYITQQPILVVKLSTNMQLSTTVELAFSLVQCTLLLGNNLAFQLTRKLEALTISARAKMGSKRFCPKT